MLAILWRVSQLMLDTQASFITILQRSHTIPYISRISELPTTFHYGPMVVVRGLFHQLLVDLLFHQLGEPQPSQDTK